MQVSKLLKGITTSNIEINFNDLCLNSNQIKNKDIFVALSGGKCHGIDYIEQAINLGCVLVLSDIKDFKCTIPNIYIKDLAQHLPKLAANCYPNAKKVQTIGITGTNGKTSVAFFIKQLLDMLNVKSGLIGTLGITNSNCTSNTTTPDILTLYKTLNQYYIDNIKIAILEVSSHSLEQNRIAKINFKQAIFTNLTQDHFDYHHTFENYKQAKLKLFKNDSIDCAIVNKDDAEHYCFLNSAKNKKHITYSIDEFTNIKINKHGFLCQLDNYVFETSLLGKFNLYNMLAALKSLEQLGFSRTKIIMLLHKLSAPKGRMHRIKNSLIFVDYAHTPDAILNAINTLKQHYPNFKISVVLGCGGNRDKDKRAKIGKIISELADLIILTNDNPRNEDPIKIIKDIQSGILNANVKVITDRGLAIKAAVSNLKPDECVLVAGKGHESYQIIKNKKIVFDDVKFINSLV